MLRLLKVTGLGLSSGGRLEITGYWCWCWIEGRGGEEVRMILITEWKVVVGAGGVCSVLSITRSSWRTWGHQGQCVRVWGFIAAQDRPLVSLVWKGSILHPHPQSKSRLSTENRRPRIDLLVLHGEYSNMSAKLFFAVKQVPIGSLLIKFREYQM